MKIGIFKKRLKSFLVCFIILLCMSSVVEADVLLDQQQLLESGGVAFWSDLPQVQTFTPSMSAKLVKIDLALSESPYIFNEMVHVSIVVMPFVSPIR